MFVDDERSYTDLISQLLTENLGWTIHPFTRPIDALRALPSLSPAVVVTDYFMPQLDGLEFIRQASALVPDAAFVLITGHNLSSEQEKLDRLPMLKGFLAKPFNWKKLADEIARVWPAGISPPAYPSGSLRS